MSFKQDCQIILDRATEIPRHWEGREAILQMKEVNYHWRQMEWWAFYFELQCWTVYQPEFSVPGDRIGRVTFDMRRTCNWDLKAKAIKSDSHDFILNDIESMDNSVSQYGEHGVVVGLCDVTYNDENRTFQKWHSDLKGGKSRYEVERELRTSVSRYRKTSANLVEVLVLRISPDNIGLLDTHHQGRNSNGRPRRPKYRMDLERISPFLVDRVLLTDSTQ